MSDDLCQLSCTPCRGGIPPLTLDEAKAYLAQTPGWNLLEEGRRLERQYRFPDFKAALDFVNRVGALAESQGHHPDLGLGWGWVTVSWWTHKINGLHANDFIMAAKTDALL
ncbi:MAG TPA: 4a-hydroxytetrahydrobiopterin dehydratase [Rhodocyclaceae bacterium]|mgnify:CR=1 FL=1|nr:4a-hydroxytetrahydrobiopterin dehydratase [Betaproteobacteria bacterium]HMV00432.1 4a-hydroxytetrahydrobiopterin dehydratase [Rhodocyclaceae bacterium]HMV21993.1 4a-hydroxytetrahydrobiopterin dehydratase [Rhodocyclaceae bacterium]HMW76959.1 4a-hydroxytetrahydrobiopterin dehydratase [Rhodocyclaceae bacterium]HNE43476.1 4a-hydroxytetrahydrobiopterin dehydratase [Rhodocyclaceae bacterium]